MVGSLAPTHGVLLNARRLLAAVAVLVVAGVVVVAGPDPRGFLAPFAFHDPGQPPLLVLRAGALFVALSALRRAPRVAALVIALFLLSLAVRGGVYLLLLAAGAVLVTRDDDSRAPLAVLSGSLAVAVALAVAPLLAAHPAPPDPGDARAMVAYWQGRKNPYQARWWALGWTREEAAAPGDAYLTLATLDWDLGRDTQARKVLAKVIERGPLPARERAASLQTAWDQARPAPP